MYDPVTDTWYPSITRLPTPVSFAGACSIKVSDSDHRIYVFGGFDSSGNVLSTVQYYTIETASWSTGVSITSPRANINAVRLNNKIYIMGGSSSNASASYTSNTTTYAYYPAGDSWTTMTVFGATASERFMLASDSVIYNFAGRNAYATLIPVTTNHLGFNIYQSVLGAETTATETVLTSARTGIAGDIYEASSGDVMIIAGGFTALTKSATATSVITNTTSSTSTNLVQYLAYPFITSGSSWQTGTATGTTFPSRGFGSSVVYYSSSLSPNYRLYNFGGTDNLSSASGSIGAGWIDLPQPPDAWTYTWTSVTNMPTGRYGFTAVKIQQ